MLASELSLVGKIAVDGYSKEVSKSIDTTQGQMGTLIADLRRTCTSTSYTYLYAMEVLDELISESKKQSKNGTADAPGLELAARKWERLKEELEEEMLKPHATGTTFQRKRRIDVALAMSDLVQRQRRRIDPTADGENKKMIASTVSPKHALANTLDDAIAGFLTKSSLGNQIDKDTAESMLNYAYGGSTDRIGDLLIKHPSAVNSLLRNMFGSKRVRQLETRRKCARLVALAVIASERSARSSSQIDIAESDEDFLCQVSQRRVV